jgi:WD40 repeat protein
MPNGTSTRLSTARSGVFISYARSDGEEFATVLRRRLDDEGVPLWQDRVGMEGGRDWWLQITEALDRVEFMALVMTPNALQSDTVGKEWRYARQQGVCVYPIKGTPELDFGSLPHWMRSAHFYDLGTVENTLHGSEWQKFVNDLKTRCQVRRVPFMVGDLPVGFVPRPGEFHQLLKLLCDERREEPVAITAALRGAGGYGKTTLAKALCHDERIQDAFDDGILWVTLGENPGDLTGWVKDLIVILGDERSSFTALDAAVSRLKEMLADRDILIVIDDVWDRAHLTPFTQGGSRCARLITTRNLETLPASAEKVQVDAMQQAEATALLAAGLDKDSRQHKGFNRMLAHLASRLGEWPLLLGLVNSAMRIRIENEHQSPRDAVIWVNKALDKHGLTYFDAHHPMVRHQAVASTIGVSLDLLSLKERDRYGELAIFPEHVDIPLATLEKLWHSTGGLDEFDTEALCSRLNRFSLLSSYNANQQRIRVHDVFRQFLIGQQLGKLPSIHAQLLDAHRSVDYSTSMELWSEMPAEEPYLWEQLAHHLVDACRGDELVTTVKDWRYLVAKTLKCKSLAVESDLGVAEKIASDDKPLRLLRRNFLNSGHLLNRCENKDDMEVTLFSRFGHLNDLAYLTRDLEHHLKRPFLMPASQLPDLPHPALVRTLRGHGDRVTGCAISQDGTTIVSVSADQTLKVWDGWSGAERFTLSGHALAVSGCAMSADGKTIVSASADRTLRVWDGHTGLERFTLSGHTGAVSGCAVTVDGAMIVSASEDHTLKVWDGLSGVERFTLGGHAARVTSCAVSADGAIVVSGSDDKTLKVWDGLKGAERFTLDGHAGAVTGCALSADRTTLVSSSADNTLKVWDVESEAERFTLRGHADWVTGCAVSEDGAIIVSASDDQTVKVWDGPSGAERFTLSGHAKWVKGCAMSADGTMIVSASDDQTLRLWDRRSGAERFTLSGHTDGVRGCAVSADGKTIVSASDDQTVKVWDGQSWAERFTLSGHSDWVTACAVSADGKTIVSASADQTVRVWDGRSGAKRFTRSSHWAPVTGCAVSADGKTIVSASADQMLRVWDRRRRAERFRLSGHAGEVNGCAVSADGATIISASEDRTLKVWDGRTGVERLTLSGHVRGVTGCAVSADGKTIISGSEDQTLKVWDGRDGAERFTLSGHVGQVNGCAVSADGATVISASGDGTLKVWDGRTGECLSTLHVDGPLDGCACSADGEIIAAAGARGVYFLRLVR